MNGGFVCPLCGTVVDADVSECPSCGEQFSPVEGAAAEPEYDEETVTEETQELFVPDEVPEEKPESDMGLCETCGTALSDDGKCPECQPPEEGAKASDGCPLCGSKSYTKESGDLVSCSGCGNVYVKKDFEPQGQNWKWKFWIGLVFILVGNVGVALGSYIHNVFRWSPLGRMYLGYGWLDQMVGVVGIVIFILGLILFAWSFKREREVQCPSCKVIIRESQFDIYEPEEEEEELPKEVAVKSALDEIGEMVECPSCGASVSMFDTSCPSCGTLFELDMEVEEAPEEAPPEESQAPEGPTEYLPASEIDQEKIIMDSLELEEPNGMSELNELEAALDLDDLDTDVSVEDAGFICPSCGARVGKGLDTCPGCGEPLSTTDGE